MNNPWEEIDLNDYEKHMSLDNVYQLQAMNKMMKEQFYAYDVKTLMILGIAGGNGLNHIKNDDFEAIYGVDINKKYLDECKNRYSALTSEFKTICTDLLSEDLQLPNSCCRRVAESDKYGFYGGQIMNRIISKIGAAVVTIPV